MYFTVSLLACHNSCHPFNVVLLLGIHRHTSRHATQSAFQQVQPFNHSLIHLSQRQVKMLQKRTFQKVKEKINLHTSHHVCIQAGRRRRRNFADDEARVICKSEFHPAPTTQLLHPLQRSGWRSSPTARRLLPEL